MKNKHTLLALAMAAAVFCITACSKNNSAESEPVGNGQQNLSLYLTDGPGLFDHVYIDIQAVKVLVDTSKDTRRHDNIDWDRRGRDDHRNDSSLVWQDLNIRAGVYDILNFRNGVDTLFASNTIVDGSIRLIKVQLGTHNSVVKDSVTYPINIPSGADNYVLIKLRGNECEQYQAGRRRLWLDFDVSRSVVVDFRNQFYLRPVFHFFTVSTTGSIAGKIEPKDGLSVVSVWSGSDTAYALPDRNGNFKLRGLTQGNYTVFVNAGNGYKDATISNVVVKAPGETSVGTIKLQK